MKEIIKCWKRERRQKKEKNVPILLLLGTNRHFQNQSKNKSVKIIIIEKIFLNTKCMCVHAQPCTPHTRIPKSKRPHSESAQKTLGIKTEI